MHAIDRKRSPSPISETHTEPNEDIDDKPLGMRALMSNKAIFAIAMSNFGLNFLCTGYEVIFVLYCYTAVLDGGLGLPVSNCNRFAIWYSAD